MKYFIIINLFLLVLISNCWCETNFMLNFKEPGAAFTGLSFPPAIKVVDGQDVMFNMLKTSENQQRCMLKFPDFSTIDLKDIKIPRFEFWGEKCGVKINKINKNDTGVWRLLSEGNEKFQGAFVIIVKDDVFNINQTAEVVYKEDGEGEIDFGRTSTSSYCHVSQTKSSEDFHLFGKCSLSLKKVNKNHQGSWKVQMGMPGKVYEERAETLVDIKAENIDVGYTDDFHDNTVHMYCNLINFDGKMHLCRFERLSDGIGFNLIDGIGIDQYRYYGQGLDKKQCGMTIKGPKSNDYGNWKCTVKADDKVLSRILTVHKPSSRQIKNENNENVVLSTHGKELKIVCNANATISYCRVKHPNGTEFTPISSNEDSSFYKYDNTDLNIGKCVLIFSQSSPGDTGTWTCHMGRLSPVGLELVDYVKVRVGGAIAAVNPSMTVKIDESINLACVTAGGNLPLTYCRFSSPDGTDFNIDETITSHKPLLEQYYFKNDSYLHSGDCSITINKVSKNHYGTWRCSAMIDEELNEYGDTIILNPEGLSTASVAGLSVGVILIVVMTLIGVLYWRRRKYSEMSGSTRPTLTQTATGRPTDESIAYFRPSGGSDESGEVQVELSSEIRKQSSYGVGSSGGR